jgi:biopolymer transport protein ExbB
VTLRDVDALVAEGRIAEAIETAETSNTPAGRILSEGLRRHEEGTERVVKAIENAGMIEMAKLEKGLVVLATVSTVAPLLGFLGTVIGMIQAFQAIELAGEVEATTVAGGIKVALITTASGLAIAIPVSIAHNYFVAKIDRLVIDMEESAQRTIDHLHDMESWVRRFRRERRSARILRRSVGPDGFASHRFSVIDEQDSSASGPWPRPARGRLA